MKKLVFACTLAAVLGTAPLSAQVWTALGTPDNVSAGSQFWDNLSDDGTRCNSGYVLTGVGGTANDPCQNQRPNPWLPYTGTTPTTYLESIGGGFQSFWFGAGAYSFTLLSGSRQAGGDVAGLNTDWGYFDQLTNTRTSLNGAGALPVAVNFTGLWGLYVQLTNGNYAYSSSDNQFALFGFNTPGSGMGNSGNSWVAGIEDIYTGAGSNSDKDYQDMLFAINGGGTPQEVVPEPATMTLLATGLIGMAAASRRRRK